MNEVFDNSNQRPLVMMSAEDLERFGLNLIEQTKAAYAEQIKRSQTEGLLTVEDVMTKLRVARSTLWRWNKEGILKQIEVGGQVRYRRADVEAYINRGARTI